MKTISILRCSIIIFFFSLILTHTVYGQASDIKARMSARLPDIVALKVSGVIGENNKGYVEYIAGKRQKTDVVDAENKDRLLVYEAIARQQGTTSEIVGVLRAQQIAERATPGDYIQNDKGEWFQK